jgi:tetratricopeptide (TPR) repeat protein
VQVAEIERANRKPATSLDAYDCYWKGLAEYWKISKSGSDAALAYFLKAIDFDKNFAAAYGFAAAVYAVRWQNRWMVDVAQERAEAVRLARRAIELGQSDEMVLCRGGWVLAAIAGELDFGAECARRGLAMNPNHAIGWLHSAWIQLYSGEHQTVRAHVRRLERLSPRDPLLFQGKLVAAFSHLFEDPSPHPSFPLIQQARQEALLEASRTTTDVTTDTNVADRQEADALAFSRQFDVHRWSDYPEADAFTVPVESGTSDLHVMTECSFHGTQPMFTFVLFSRNDSPPSA